MWVAKEMVVQKIEMAARQTVDLSQRIVDGLGVKRGSTSEERFLVAEIADMGTSARHDD